MKDYRCKWWSVDTQQAFRRAIQEIQIFFAADSDEEAVKKLRSSKQ